MKIANSRRIGAILMTAVLGTIAMLQAGSLTPPSGPIVPTMKTLSEVEPRTPIGPATTPGDSDSLYKITQSGSYYLTGNVVGVAGKTGIEVAASHVNIDLRGFSLVGVPGSLAGIDLNNGGAGNLFGITVRNGTIQDWDSDGIKGNLSGGDTFTDLEITEIAGNGITINTNSRIENCIIYRCTIDGISSSNNIVVRNTVAAGNTANGIAAGTASTVSGCSAYINAGAGIVIVGGKGTISDCSATLNSGVGIDGGNGGAIANCHADNNSNGIAVGEGGTISHCAADNNSGSGITTGGTSTVLGCSAWSNNVDGIAVSESTVADCTARENNDDGIQATGNSLVERCTVTLNRGDGIVVTIGSLVSHCVCVNNTANGISCGSDCRIFDNNCDNSGFGSGDGAGILATGTSNYIERNRASDGDRGIEVNGAFNLIVENVVSGNTTNWQVVANNKVGTIVIAPNSVAISGNTGGAGVGTTTSWSNISY